MTPTSKPITEPVTYKGYIYASPPDSGCDFFVGVSCNVVCDRGFPHSWGLSNRKLAERLIKAIDAGVVFSKPCFCTDINGKTYISATSNVMGRHMNRDLKKLGF